jgi:hypothetical protein
MLLIGSFGLHRRSPAISRHANGPPQLGQPAAAGR